jgi:hypothetical protein
MRVVNKPSLVLVPPCMIVPHVHPRSLSNFSVSIMELAVDLDRVEVGDMCTQLCIIFHNMDRFHSEHGEVCALSLSYTIAISLSSPQSIHLEGDNVTGPGCHHGQFKEY